MLCGENSRAALDYTLHYRSPHMLGIDADYRMSGAYQSQGWPSFIVVDAEGIIRFHGFDPDRNLAVLRKCVQDLAAKASAPELKPTIEGGIAFLPEALVSRRGLRDCSPRLAFRPNGTPLVVYYSNRERTNAVYCREMDAGGAVVRQSRLSPAGVESYAPDAAVAADGTLWVTWCGRSNAFYDIYIQANRSGAEPTTWRLTSSPDDAMSPRIAVGPAGKVMVAYYKWRMLGGTSRDRDIYARTLDASRSDWEPEVEISPRQPEVEDHTDPDVVFDDKGQGWVVWSFDYHPSLYKSPQSAAEPTIFAAKAGTRGVPPLLVGGTGTLRNSIDFFPSAATDDKGNVWCAWDGSEPYRTIRLARLNENGEGWSLVNSFAQQGAICSTPELSAARSDLLLAWSQRARTNNWEGRIVLLKDGRTAARIPVTDSGDVLYPQAQLSPKGEYWVTFERTSASGSEVVVRNLGNDLGRAGVAQQSR